MKWKYMCENCSFSTIHRRNMISHLRNDGKLTVYKCHHCSYETRKKNHIEHHVLIHGSSDNLYKCTTCPFITKYKRSLGRHSWKHKSIDKIELYKCKKCSFESKQQYELKVHNQIIHKCLNEIWSRVNMHKEINDRTWKTQKEKTNIINI